MDDRRKEKDSPHGISMGEKGLVVGATHIDIFADGSDPAYVIDKKGSINVGIGGTAYNIVCNLAQFGVEASLITLLKRNSLFTNIILSKIEDLNLDKKGIIFSDVQEAGFIAFRDEGNLKHAITSSPLETFLIDPANFHDMIIGSDFVIVDLNTSVDTIRNFVQYAGKLNKLVFLMGVSEIKALKLAQLEGLGHISAVFLNRFEAQNLLKHTSKTFFHELTDIIPTLWVVTKDKDGVSLYENGREVISYPAPRITDNGSFSGAGDAFSAGFIFSKYLCNGSYKDSIIHANKYVKEVIKQSHANLVNDNVLHNASEIIFRDPLTKVFNRKFFETEKTFIEKQAAVCPVYLGVFDIDNFKRINDTYGHDSGDAVLRTFGQIIKTSIRKEDLVIRFGGEEFIVILFNIEGNIALDVTNRIRTAFKDTVVSINGHRISTTVSGGLALLDNGRNIDQVFKDADEALYEAKHGGKDRICLANISS